MSAKFNQSRIVAALDIGTTKICAVVAHQLDDKFEILGISNVSSLGLKKGIVVNMSQAVNSIRLALKEAELASGCKITSAVVGISGSHIQSLSSQASISVKKDRVKEQDITKVLEMAKAVSIPTGYQILHSETEHFTIDDYPVSDPIDMYASRLQAKVHIIIGSVSYVQNLIRCCELAGIFVSDIVLEHLASADAVLSVDEKMIGCGVLDIGGGTSDFAVFNNGTIKDTKVFSVASSQITNDLAVCLRSSLKDAERVKFQYDVLKNTGKDETVEIELAQGQVKQSVPVHMLTSVIESRVYELFSLLEQEIRTKNLQRFMPAGIILTGGGSLLHGIDRIAQTILNCPVRLGAPNFEGFKKDSISSPIYSTVFGLMKQKCEKSHKNFENNLTGPLISRIFMRMKSWVTGTPGSSTPSSGTPGTRNSW